MDRRSTVSRRDLRAWPRILAGLRLHPRLAADDPECFQRSADVLVACDSVPADVRDYSIADLSLWQGRILRLDLLVRRDGRNVWRSAPPQDAARTGVESAES